MNIHELEKQYKKMKWRGVERFTATVRWQSLHETTMDSIWTEYGSAQCEMEYVSANRLYTVEHYLSDLISRHKRLTKAEVEALNKSFDAIADVMEQRARTIN